MIHPSYTELIQAINNNAEEDDNTMMLNSRYSLVLATSKRARQLIAEQNRLLMVRQARNRLRSRSTSYTKAKLRS